MALLGMLGPNEEDIMRIIEDRTAPLKADIKRLEQAITKTNGYLFDGSLDRTIQTLVHEKSQGYHVQLKRALRLELLTELKNTVRQEIALSRAVTPQPVDVAAIKRELGKRWALGIVLGQCAIAWVVAFAVYRIALLAGLG